MTPEARIAATIELLEQVHEAALSGGAAADNIVRGYFRKRRFAGSKDRRDITENIYAILHDYEALAWRIEACDGAVNGRSLVITRRLLKGENPDVDFTGAGYGAAPLDDAEKHLCARLGELKDPLPEAAGLNCPAWLEPAFRTRFGDDFAAALQALNSRGQATFRVNSLKMSREAALEQLGHDDKQLIATTHSPWGLGMAEKSGNLRGSPLFKKGVLEVQDEASQIACMLVDARPGMQVLDLCAGAGGKSLALAAAMENKGQIYAADINARRLGRLKDRYRRAGARNIQIITLPEGNPQRREQALKHCLGAMDRVVVDAPCSGTGTWRHNPELRLRTTAAWLEKLRQTQAELLSEAASFVKPGGRLVYMTCSLLAEENEIQLEEFLAAHQGWSMMPFATIWKEAGAGAAPGNLSRLDGALQLDPRDGTDGFFVAILKAP